MRTVGSTAGILLVLALTSAGCCCVSNKIGAGAATSIALPAGTTKLVNATIDKGVAHHILVVEATIQQLGIVPPGDSMTMYPDVNGLGMQPDPSTPSAAQVYKMCFNPYFQPDGSGDYPVCLFSATWWLDLDVAEAAHPGTLIGKPLIVTLNTTTAYGRVANANVSLVAHLGPK